MFNSSKLTLWLSLTPLIISLILTMFILIFFRHLPPKLPLFYSLPWGEEQMVNHQQFLIIPASITLITLLNLIISWQLHLSQTFFKNVLIFSSLLNSLVLTITFVKIFLIFL